MLFLHNEGSSTLCGHGIIGLVTVLLETGLIEVKEKKPALEIDSPAGRVKALALVDKNRVKEVSFQNVPSFVYAQDKVTEIPGVGPVRYDIAFGGAFYVFYRAEDLGLWLIPEEYSRIIELGKRIKKALMDIHLPLQPFEKDLSFLYGTIFVGSSHNPHNHS